MWAVLLLVTVLSHCALSCPSDLALCDGWARWNDSASCQARGCVWCEEREEGIDANGFGRKRGTSSGSEEEGIDAHRKRGATSGRCYYGTPPLPTKVVHVIQACHFDAGFINTTVNIVNLWWHTYFPLAHSVGEQLAQNATSPDSPRLNFTAQSWLVALFLNCPPQLQSMGVVCPSAQEIALFKDSVAKGYITWHAFPFNAEPEIADMSLFEFGVNLTHQLDDMFGKRRKRVLSQRDVPGMTSAVIPLLLRNGVEAISVGVNGGSAAPNVPGAFIWRHAPSGKSVRVFYAPGGYGGDPVGKNPFAYTAIPGSDQVVVLDWRNDNSGPPPTPGMVLMHWMLLKEQFGPNVEIRASTFDTFLDSIANVPDSAFPVIEAEIGDSWIYGIASDPLKVQQMRALNRARSDCVGRGKCSDSDSRVWMFSTLALKNIEHTWGGDVKTILTAAYVSSNWTNADFNALLAAKDPRFLHLQSTWAEQRQIGITAAVQALQNHPLAKSVAQEMAKLTPRAPNVNGNGWLRVAPGGKFSLGSLSAAVDAQTGQLSVAGQTLGKLTYVTYCTQNYSDFTSDYAYDPQPQSWWKLDFLKTNLPPNVVYSETPALLQSLYYNAKAQSLYAVLKWPQALHSAAGAPAVATVEWAACNSNKALCANVVLWNKTATRLPEATFFSVVGSASWTMAKLGSPGLDPYNVVNGGSKHLHSVDSVSNGAGLTVYPLDAPLASFGHTLNSMSNPIERAPQDRRSVSFILHDNAWDTNYIMWYPFQDADATTQFRFEFTFAK